MAAGKFGSQSAGLLIDGYDIRASKLKSLSYEIEAKQEESHGIGDSYKEHTPVGLTEVTFQQGEAFFDTTALYSHAAFSTSVPTSPQATQRIACMWFGGLEIGSPAVGIQAHYTEQYNVLAKTADLTKANVTHRVSGQADHGVILNALATKSGDWNTKTDGAQVDYTADTSQQVIPITSNSQANPTVVTTPIPHGLTSGQVILISGVSGSSPTINGERTVTVISTTTFSVPVDTSAGAGGTGGSFVRGSTVNGGVGYQEVTQCAGFTNFVGKIRDSADDSTYADLLSFADNVSDPYAERVTVAGTVDRYLSYDGNVTGTGTINVFAMFSRA